MKRCGGSFAVLALGGCIGLATAGAFGQSSEQGNSRRQSSPPSNTASPPPNTASPPPNTVSPPSNTPPKGLKPTPSQIRPLPDSGHVPMPEMGGRTPLGGSGGLPPVPSGRARAQQAPRDLPADPGSTSDGRDDDGTISRGRGGYSNDSRRYRRPGYYGYDRYRYYDGPYRYYDDYRGYDDGYRPYEPPVPGVPGGGFGYDRADAPATEPPAGQGGLGSLLPPDDLMDEGVPPLLRKALDDSPEYREAMAQLLRAWADYARAAEPVLQRLRKNAAYQRALNDLRDAETKAATFRDRPNVPAVNLVTAAQQVMLARRAVRAQEAKAIDADPAARRAKQQLDQAIERRNKVRDDIAATLPPEQLEEPAS